MTFEAKSLTCPIYVGNQRGCLAIPDIHNEAEFDLVLRQVEHFLDTFAQIASAPPLIVLEENRDG